MRGMSFRLRLTLRIFAFKENRIKHRAHDGKGDMTEIFAGKNIPGLYGGRRAFLESGICPGHPRHKDEATRGSYQKLSFKFTEGVDGGKARFSPISLMPPNISAWDPRGGSWPQEFWRT